MVSKKEDSTQKEPWLKNLEQLVRKHPLAVLRFDSEELEIISQTQRGMNSFSIAFPHGLLQELRPPTACLLLTKDYRKEEKAYFGLAVRKSPVTTFDSRLMIESARPIAPNKEESLIALVTEKRFATDLRNRFKNQAQLVHLSPALSVHLINRLAEVEGNKNEMRRAFAKLESPRTYSGNRAFQEDALKSALQVFGLTLRDAAVNVETVGPTALDRVHIHEDAVIEHDARDIPEFTLTASDLTGRAVFKKGLEQLEVITANKRPLEEVFGVDLIYLNAIKRNIVMVQYKMLEPLREDKDTDWIYRPDAQFEKQLASMKRFSSTQPPEPHEYRINPQAFYLKFVQRDASLSKSSITMPIDHFDVLRNDPACAGSRGAFRISFNTLDGRYLRQNTFFDLIRSGYIGTHAETTTSLAKFIEWALKNNRAVVAALHSHGNSINYYG